MNTLQRFWQWYERHYLVAVAVSAFLFLLQLIHLYWLTADVVVPRLGGTSWWSPGAMGQLLIAIVDYLEIPTIISVSLVYINELRQRWNGRTALLFVLLNSQWLHLFWITDEIVVERLLGTAPDLALPLWLAWCAIVIDYFELPVIVDTVRRFIVALRTPQAASTAARRLGGWQN